MSRLPTAERRATRAALLATLALLACACESHRTRASSTDSASRGASPQTSAAAPDAAAARSGPPTHLGDERPARVLTPDGWAGTPERRWPLVVVLHGLGGSGPGHARYLGLVDRVDADGFVLLAPDGTRDGRGRRFWNATESCCDFEGRGVDDVGYLLGLVEEAVERLRVDPERVYLVGHSNGGFMAYRMACAAGFAPAAIVSLAGAPPREPGACADPQPTSVLQIHGTADRVIPYAGAERTIFDTPGFPGARQAAERWASERRSGCEHERALDRRLDLVAGLPAGSHESGSGADTSVRRWSDCRDGARVELWTIEGGEHVPRFTPQFSRAIVDFLFGRDGAPTETSPP